MQDPIDIIEGRFINQEDIHQKRKIAIIGQSVAKEMYHKEEDIIGSHIKINGIHFKVVGTYKSSSKNGNAEENQKKIFIPFTTFQLAFNYGNKVGWMAITAHDKESITTLKKDIITLMKTRHKIHPEDDRAIGNFDLYEEYKKVNGLFFILKAIAYFVGILVLVSGIIGIMNIMLIVVKEQTKEIGIRRALGATPWNIRSQILSESIVITILSGMLGIVMATALLWLINNQLDKIDPQGTMMFANPAVDLTVVFIALLILILSGLLAGFIPAQNAIRIKPVDALRTE